MQRQVLLLSMRGGGHVPLFVIELMELSLLQLVLLPQEHLLRRRRRHGCGICPAHSRSGGVGCMGGIGLGRSIVGMLLV